MANLAAECDMHILQATSDCMTMCYKEDDGRSVSEISLVQVVITYSLVMQSLSMVIWTYTFRTLSAMYDQMLRPCMPPWPSSIQLLLRGKTLP